LPKGGEGGVSQLGGGRVPPSYHPEVRGGGGNEGRKEKLARGVCLPLKIP